jgi:alkylhydroperoxidase family enzyme
MTTSFARLRRFYDDDALVELTAIIAWENASSKFNRALRVPSQGLWKRAGLAEAPAEPP